MRKKLSKKKSYKPIKKKSKTNKWFKKNKWLKIGGSSWGTTKPKPKPKPKPNPTPKPGIKKGGSWGKSFTLPMKGGWGCAKINK